jgi:hypothetical protein
MNTETYIANLALGQAGVSATIQSLDERSAEAQRCRPHMEIVRKQTLEAFDWSFARRRAALAVHGDAAPDQWALRYTMPANCIKFRRIWNPASADVPVPFDQELSLNGEQLTILTNMGDAIGIWTQDVSNLGLTTAHFQHTMAALLGAIIAMPTSKNRNIKNDLMQQFFGLIREASALADQSSSPEEKFPDWITGR